uniref:Uncharacterized protein n=1 Tax=Cannabis sativa TaxID=3483 RepID=A0A803QMF0_CANSA
MLLALSTGLSGPGGAQENAGVVGGGGGMITPNSNSSRKGSELSSVKNRKRRCTNSLSELVGRCRRDEDIVMEFCNDVGVDKGVLKVWMHNNKNTLGKKDINGGGASTDDDDDGGVHVATNGSSSTS